ncbi:unnamed protein product, partial [Ectocarpus sp. 6 AP-2014]
GVGVQETHSGHWRIHNSAGARGLGGEKFSTRVAWRCCRYQSTAWLFRCGGGGRER